MPQLFTNAARSLLQASILSTDTSLTVEAAKADLFPVADTGTGTVPATTGWFKATLQDASGNIEIVYVRTRAAASAVFSNVMRAQEGTMARAFSAGVVVGLRVTAADVQSALAVKAASDVTNTPAGNIAATTVQAAINELDAEKQGILVNSAGLAAALSDETGSGSAVFANSPTLSAPNLGTPASGALDNCTSNTEGADNNTEQLATTAFVVGQAGTATPQPNGTAAVGTSLRYSRQDHVHIQNVVFGKKWMESEHQGNTYRHAALILSDNSVRSFGEGNQWHHGTGDNGNINGGRMVQPGFPSTFPGADRLFQSSNFNHYCIDVNGQVWSWGQNHYGQGGNGTNAVMAIPVNVSLISGNSIFGKVVTKFATPNGVEDIGFAMCLTSDGQVHAIGYNGYGQVGNGNTADQWFWQRCGTITGITDIACGRERYTACIATNGLQTYTWGYNGDSQLGSGNATSTSTPTLRVNSLTGKTIVKVRANQLNLFALANDGTLHGCGNNNYGNFGLNTRSVYNLWVALGITGVSDFYAGNYDYAVLLVKKSDNTFWVAGYEGYLAPITSTTPVYDGYGVLTGYSYTYANMNIFQPVSVPTTDNGVAVTCTKFYKGGTGSYNWLMFLMSNGSVYTTGYNGNGQLCVGDLTDRRINGLARVNLPGVVTDICGWGRGTEGTAGFITANGKVWAGGYGGNASNGSYPDRHAWIPIPLVVT